MVVRSGKQVWKFQDTLKQCRTAVNGLLCNFLPRLKTCHHHNYHFPEAALLHGFPILIDFFMIKIRHNWREYIHKRKGDRQAMPFWCTKHKTSNFLRGLISGEREN